MSAGEKAVEFLRLGLRRSLLELERGVLHSFRVVHYKVFHGATRGVKV